MSLLLYGVGAEIIFFSADPASCGRAKQNVCGLFSATEIVPAFFLVGFRLWKIVLSFETTSEMELVHLFLHFIPCCTHNNGAKDSIITTVRL